MTKKADKELSDLTDDGDSGWLSSFLAEEEDLDRRALWKLGSWGVGTVGAVIVSILAVQSPAGIRRDQLAAAQAQAQQLQWIAKDSQDKARQLAAAVDTLNSDRDRLYARVTVLEENLESVTGAIAKQKAAAALPTAPVAPLATAESNDAAASDSKSQSASQLPPPPKIAPVAAIPVPTNQKAAAVTSAKKEQPTVTGALSTSPDIPTNEDKPVQKTAFGVELGGANSVEGLRAIWRVVNKTNGTALASLQPIVVIKEGNDGLGMKLRLVAGPLDDAAAAAKICAVLIANNRTCTPSVYDGQRLALQDEKKPDSKPAVQKKRSQSVTAPPASSSPISSLFGFR